MLPRTLELNAWTSEKKCRQLVENLTRKHFTAVYCATAQEAADYILKQAEGAQNVGFGGSLSVADLKLKLGTPAEEGARQLLYLAERLDDLEPRWLAEGV